MGWFPPTAIFLGAVTFSQLAILSTFSQLSKIDYEFLELPPKFTASVTKNKTFDNTGARLSEKLQPLWKVEKGEMLQLKEQEVNL